LGFRIDPDEVRERFYAASVERRSQHPAIVAISEHARGRLFPTGLEPVDQLDPS